MKAIEHLVEQIPLKAISVVANARTDMDAKKLEELKATITAGGIRTPLILSPLKAAGVTLLGKYRVVCGHRRFTAAKDLELDSVPAIVRDLTDDEIEVEQLVENDAREDLTALDRAAQYSKLRERGLDAADISKRVGRARSTVELTLRLADLVDGGKKALRDGWLPQGAAEELALLSPGVQKDGLKLLEDLDQDGQLTRDRAREVLRRELLLDLAEVKFDTRDPNLVPAAGACIPDCTKRTGAQPDLFGGGKGPDCCTDRPCLRVKEGAWLRLQEKAGVKVLSSAEAKQVFPYEHSNSVSRDSGYALADEKDYQHPQSKTFKAQLGKEAKSKVVLTRAPDGQVVELVARKDLPKPTSSSSTTKTERSPAEKRKAEEAKVRRLVAERALDAIATAADSKDLSARDADRLIVEELLESVGNDRRKLLASHLEANGELKVGEGWDGANKALRKHLEKCKGDAHHLVGFAFQLIGAGALGSYGSLDSLKPACKLLDVDLVDIQKAVELERREKKKAKASPANPFKDLKPRGAKTAKRKAAARTATLPDAFRSIGLHQAAADLEAVVLGNCGAIDGKPGTKNGPCIMSAPHDGAHSNGYRTWPQKKLERPTESTDPIQWLPKKHPQIVAVGLGHGGRRYEIYRAPLEGSKTTGFAWRGGKRRPRDQDSVIATGARAKESEAMAGAEKHEREQTEREPYP